MWNLDWSKMTNLNIKLILGDEELTKAQMLEPLLIWLIINGNLDKEKLASLVNIIHHMKNYKQVDNGMLIKPC